MVSTPGTALILGLGSIGRELAALLRRDGMQVWGVKRTLDERSRRLCDRLLDADSWRGALPRVDLCFLALPLTRKTQGLVDASVLRALPPHAVLVNVGHAGTLDTQAVVQVLKEGHLGGVGLDVIDPVPPVSDDPIWEAPRLLITPHVAAHYPERARDLEGYCEAQLHRYVTGEPLENIVAWGQVE